MIDAALAAGATSMDGLTFRVADPTEALAEARRSRRGRRPRPGPRRSPPRPTSGSARSSRSSKVGERSAGPPRPVAEFRMKAAADASTPVEAGTTELTISVAVEFAIG